MTRPLVALLALFSLPAGLGAQPRDVVARAEVEPKAVRLAQPVRLTLTIEGPAPLRGAVELPDQLLTADANRAWRIRPDKDRGAAEVTALPGGRERWQRVFRLDPWVPKDLLGQEFSVTLAPAKVAGRVVEWPEVRVLVKRTGAEGAPLPEAHAVTAVEDVPPPPEPTGERATAPWLAGAGALLVVCVGVAAAVWRRGRKLPPVPPDERARAALATLERSGAGGAELAERVAEVLRVFVEARFGIPAPKLTTAELSAAAAEQRWPVEQAEALRALVDECDRAKFAGHAPDDDRVRGLVRAARDWLDDVSRAAGPR